MRRILVTSGTLRLRNNYVMRCTDRWMSIIEVAHILIKRRTRQFWLMKHTMSDTAAGLCFNASITSPCFSGPVGPAVHWHWSWTTRRHPFSDSRSRQAPCSCARLATPPRAYWAKFDGLAPGKALSVNILLSFIITALSAPNNFHFGKAKSPVTGVSKNK